MKRTVRKLTNNRFEFSTVQEPYLEKHTIVEMREFIQMCDDNITTQETTRIEWLEKIAEAEKLNGSL